MSVCIQKLKQSIDRLIQFLNGQSELSNGHIVDYFTKSLYRACISEEIRGEISTLGFERAIEIILTESSTSAPHLTDFIKTCKSFALYSSNICMTRLEFLNSLNRCDNNGVKLKHFATSKKAHEVEMLSVIAKNILDVCKTTHLVDIGDGKGYLSSTISFQHNIPVLGVDASITNTESSIRRANLLSKRWKDTAELDKNANDNKTVKNYKQITQIVTEKTDFKKLIQDIFLEEPNGIGLIGLHTCGNLGPTSLRIFNANANIKSICNVSCCYHLLNEQYAGNCNLGSVPNQKDEFPMSQYLIGNRDFTLSRAARMLSAQSIDRILARRELPNKTIFYRAALEVILQKYYKTSGNVGRFRKEPAGFLDYAKESLKRLQLVQKLDDREISSIFEEFKGKHQELMVFNLMRVFLAPAIESLILLDRALYLKEQGVSQVFLVKLFDPVVSPRCYGLIALK